MNQTIHVEFDIHSTNKGGWNKNDEYSRNSYSYNWYYKGIKKGRGSYRTVIKDYNPDSFIYLVYVIYSTGDSFSHDDRSRCEIIAATHSLKTANKIKDFIKEDLKKSDSDPECYKEKEVDGIKFYTYMWKGYFESHDSTEMEVSAPLG